MKHFRKNGGFTLVELMVSILIGTIITGAAVTVLLLGLRMNRSSIDTASRQNTTRILMSVLENLASEGKITNVKTTLQSWEVKERDNVLLSYSADKQAIYTGKAPTAENDMGTPILEGVYASHVSLEGQLLVISVQTEDGSYTSSVYCRIVELNSDARDFITELEAMAEGDKFKSVTTSDKSWKIRGANDSVLLSYEYVANPDGNGGCGTIYKGANPRTKLLDNVSSSFVQWDGQLLFITFTTAEGEFSTTVKCEASSGNAVTNNTKGRAEFLEVLLSQKDRTILGTTTYNPGLILDENGVSTGKYYTEWYIGDYATNPGWNKDTPWCVAYVSWCLEEVKTFLQQPQNGSAYAQVPKYANVDTFLNDLKQGNTNGSYITRVEHSPQPGDLVFFDWDSGTDPEHMGVVLSVAGGNIYTIEGNTAGRVALRQYSLGDSRIIGYGVLNWVADTN